MRVLGVDPGLTRCGIGVVDGLPGRRAALVDVRVVRTPPDGDLGARLLAVAEAVERAIVDTSPDAVAVERVFSQHNIRTVMGTAQASGIAVLAAARAGLPVALHTPSEVKAAVTGSGRADKQQVTSMVVRILRLDERPTPADAADALAIAVCHLWSAALPPVRDGLGSPPGDGATAAQVAWALAGRTAAAGRGLSPLERAARAQRAARSARRPRA